MLILFFSFSIVSAQDNYVLQKITENSDINYQAFKCLDFESCRENREKWISITQVFEPIQGEFITYNFIKAYEGLSFTGENKTFHDLLILKVNPETLEIMDGFQFTKEWAEFPPTSDLYRFSGKNIILKNELKISDLNFIIDESHRGYGKDFLKDESLILIK